MLIVISISVLAVVLSYLSYYRGIDRKSLFKLSFFLITFLQIIYFNYGNDYMGYYEAHSLYQIGIKEMLHLKSIGHGAFKDMGWAVISSCFPGNIGFFVMVGTISIIRNYIFYKFIIEYTEKKNRWKALTIYLFTSSFYLMNFSGIRQGLTVSICVLSVMLAVKRRCLILPIMLVIVSSTIHGSALVMLPFLFLTKLQFRNGKIYALLIGVTTIVLFSRISILNFLLHTAFNFVPSLESKYGHYLNDMASTKSSVGIGFLLNLVMYLIMLYNMIKKFDSFQKEYRIFIVLTSLGLMIIPFQLHLSGLIGRVGTYFIVFQIVTVPMVYSKIRDKLLRFCISFIYFFMMFYGYYEFLFVNKWSAVSYRYFDTIFGVL